MSNPEQISDPITELQLDTVEMGDAVVLRTRSGSTYHLQIIETEEDGAPLAIMSRDSARPIWRTDDMPADTDDLLRLKLKGCCETVAYRGGERLYPVDGIDGCFKTGMQAWLALESEDNNIITSPVDTIELIKA